MKSKLAGCELGVLERRQGEPGGIGAVGDGAVAERRRRLDPEGVESGVIQGLHGEAAAGADVERSHARREAEQPLGVGDLAREIGLVPRRLVRPIILGRQVVMVGHRRRQRQRVGIDHAALAALDRNGDALGPARAEALRGRQPQAEQPAAGRAAHLARGHGAEGVGAGGGHGGMMADMGVVSNG